MSTLILTLGMIISRELQLLTDQRDNVQIFPCPKLCMEFKVLTAYNKASYLKQSWLTKPNSTCDDLTKCHNM